MPLDKSRYGPVSEIETTSASMKTPFQHWRLKGVYNKASLNSERQKNCLTSKIHFVNFMGDGEGIGRTIPAIFHNGRDRNLGIIGGAKPDE